LNQTHEEKIQENILVVENLRQYFKVGSGKRKAIVKAVHNVSFQIKKGEVFGMVGETGCGKTTCGRSIIGLYTPTDGQVFFKGERISMGLKQIAREVMALKRERTALKNECKRQIGVLNQDHDTIEATYRTKKQELVDEYNNQRTIIQNETKAKIADIGDNIAGLKGEKSKGDIPPNEFDAIDMKLDRAQTERDATLENQKNLLDSLAERQREDLDRLQEALRADLGLVETKSDSTVKDVCAKNDEAVAKIDQQIRSIKNANRPNRELMGKMQMIFQDPIASLNPRMTVREIVAEGLIIRGERDKDYMLSEVYRVLKLVGLVPEHAGRYPHEFSGGQRQRIGIARSLIVNPDLIIADEPISALDVSIQAQVINLLNDLKHDLGLTILFIAHDLSVVKMFSDRIGVMYYGRMVELTTKDELFKNPIHPYTRALLSAIPHPDPIPEKKRKRGMYDPRKRVYTKEKPQMLEIKPDHYVYCSPEELEEYKKLLND